MLNAPSPSSTEFSHRSRAATLARFGAEEFDLLIVGGGITGAAVARDAATRGLRVALVERNDYAFGTSSRSSKLIHGGLRYLENFEFHLVFEALAERALLLKTVPHMVRPLPFYLPIFKGDKNGRYLLGMGLWLYDLLALFRTPSFHKFLPRRQLLKVVPFLRTEGLVGGFRYYDASMWDDVLAVEILRSAQGLGVATANYVEAVKPLWNSGEGEKAHDSRITGFTVRDRETGKTVDARAKRVVICAGPWTDSVGLTLSPQWHTWLAPSKGVHLIFDLKRLPVPGAMTMTNPSDGRFAFVIPRPDFGPGVTIVGTTDGPSPAQPENATVEKEDVDYLLGLLHRYFPGLKLVASDILSAYVGVRPLMAPGAGGPVGNDGKPLVTAESLKSVSREHHIGMGPGGTVLVAGGKYTTHRTMAEEIVDYAMHAWRADARKHLAPQPPHLRAPSTRTPINPLATDAAVAQAREAARSRGWAMPEGLYTRYGAEALGVFGMHRELEAKKQLGPLEDPEGFPCLEAQLRYAMRHGMVLHLEDFYIRRIPLYAARADHGLPWAERLAQVWADERDLGAAEASAELARLREELGKRSAWKTRL